MRPQRDPLEAIVRRMGQPSWLILAVLDPVRRLPGTQIIDRVEELLAQAGFPDQTLDPSTVHHALKRMIEDGLVQWQGRQEVDVPGPHATTHRALRDVYVITGAGATALEYKGRLDRVVNRGATAHAG